MWINSLNVEKNAKNALFYFFQIFFFRKKHYTLANSNHTNL